VRVLHSRNGSRITPPELVRDVVDAAKSSAAAAGSS